MAQVYYDAQATGANNGTTKADAYQTFTLALAGAGSLGTIWASHTSNEVLLANTVYTVAGQRCVSMDFTGSTPPVSADITPGALIDGGTAFDITIRGTNAHTIGIHFIAGDDWKQEGSELVIEDASLGLQSTLDKITLTSGHLILVNSNLVLPTSSSQISAISGGDFTMTGGTVVAAGGMATLIINGGGGGRLIFKGVDLSVVTTALINFSSTNRHTILRVIGCLLNAGVALQSGTPHPLLEAHAYGSSDTNKPYYIQEETYEGVIQVETTVVKTGGSSDDVTPISLKYVTNSKAAPAYHPLINRMPVLFWADTIGNNTFDVDILTDGITLGDDNAWLEIEHPQAGIQRGNDTSRGFDGNNLPASAAAWTTTGIGVPVKQKLSLTVNVAQKGWVEAYICVADFNVVVYADVKILDGARQYLAGTAYINGPAATACDYPIEADVRLGVDYDSANLTGTAAIPGADDVRDGVATDATVGNYEPAPEANVLIDFDYGANGTEFKGTLSPFAATYELPQEVITEDEEFVIFEGCE